jgi:hypothetical protein
MDTIKKWATRFFVTVGVLATTGTAAAILGVVAVFNGQ